MRILINATVFAVKIIFDALKVMMICIALDSLVEIQVVVVELMPLVIISNAGSGYAIIVLYCMMNVLVTCIYVNSQHLSQYGNLADLYMLA